MKNVQQFCYNLLRLGSADIVCDSLKDLYLDIWQCLIDILAHHFIVHNDILVAPKGIDLQSVRS